MCWIHGIPIPITIAIPRTRETAVTTAANVNLSTVGKPDEYTPPSRPHNGDAYVRRTGSTRNSARNSRIVVQTGSHHSVALPVRPGQVVRVSSTRSHNASSRIPIPDAPRRASQLLVNGPDYGHSLVYTASPPVRLHAPTPPRIVTPRGSATVVTAYREHTPPRATQQSFHSHHSSHSRHSHHSRNGSHHSRSGSRHSRSGSTHSRQHVVDPPASDTSEVRIMRSRSDAGHSGHRYSPSSPSSPWRSSMGNIQPVISREKSRERTSDGRSYLDVGRVEAGLKREEIRRVENGEVRGLLGGGDNGEAVRIVYGRGPRVSAGRLGTTGERNMEYAEGGRRHYGSQYLHEGR